MKYSIFIICILFICGCHPAAETAETATTTTTVATVSGEKGDPMLYLEGKLYQQDPAADVLNDTLGVLLHPTGTPSAFTLVGITVAEVNTHVPDSERTASHVPPGTEIYRHESGRLYLLRETQLLPLCEMP